MASQPPAARSDEASLGEIVARVARLLPAQGPIGIFIHHNPLHAFEHLPFERAVLEASDVLGTEPFVAEARYRAELARGRILEADLEAVLARELGETASNRVAGFTTRGELRALLLARGLPEGPHPQVEWLVRETGVLERMYDAVPDASRARLLVESSRGGGARERGVERRALPLLWEACVRVAERSAPVSLPATKLRRHRDLLLEITGVDADELVHPVLVRSCAAFLDQGVAYWRAPSQDLGFNFFFTRIHGPSLERAAELWLRALAPLVAADRAQLGDDLSSVARSLDALGVGADEREPYLLSTALALRGWAGMMRQVEERPDRVPVWAPPATLAGFLAVRLLLDRAAASHVAREHGLEGSLSELWSRRASAQPERATRHPSELAWELFHAAQLLGRTGPEIDRLPEDAAQELVAELERFDALARRRLLHLAYERRHRRVMLDALGRHRPQTGSWGEVPEAQAIFCLDEREESLRRHLEEVAPSCETLGAAGFFGVAMHYRGIGDAHARPLCPIVIVPEHEIEELPLETSSDLAQVRRASRRGLGKLSASVMVGSRTFVRGTVISAVAGALAAVPLTLRVLFPRLAAKLGRHGARLVAPTRRTRLAVDRRPDVTPSEGRFSGFTKEEMAAIVRKELENIGLVRGFAPLVFVIGHGSSSLNNPHESAHDCGACGGGHGGPNARAFAHMANDPAVREQLAAAGIDVPEETWFVGAEHNTCDDRIDTFDADRIPAHAAEAFARISRYLDEARARDAHERCRRFENVPLWFPKELALAHVEGRSEDLAQPRPEYGHATNALCVVGRRERTRGLFLDRRAFLVSYDPTRDDAAGAILSRVLGAVVPVVAGINLEYWFGYVDPVGYGSGTKLPHNITALLGVMDGHASDLRTGLPWQMLEIHEPVRLLIVVEARPEVLSEVIARSPTIARLVRNEWILMASLDPDGPALHEHDGSRARAYEADARALAVVERSEHWYRGKRAPLGPAAVLAPRADASGAAEAPS